MTDEEGEGRTTRPRLVPPDKAPSFPMATPWPNNSGSTAELDESMRFNDGHVVSIATYSVLLVVSAVFNISLLCYLLKRRRRSRSRINTMLLHLAIADLLVTFLMMPLEIGWAVTVSWKAGDIFCRLMAFFRVFGLFLSGFVLACVSIDRYYAVLKPLQLNHVDRRVKLMLSVAWIASFACSLPQAVVFHLETHPNVTWYQQCVTYNSFPSTYHELTYSMFGMIMMYALPLLVITFSYVSILAEIFRRSREAGVDMDAIRRSSLGYLGKAKVRTLKMTVTIVLVFFVCWTPYNVMSLWYWFDYKSAQLVDQRAQRALFLFACTNSCANPLVYGIFNFRRGRGKFRQRPRGARGTVIGTQRFERSLSDAREDILMENRWKTYPPTQSTGVGSHLEEKLPKKKTENGRLPEPTNRRHI